MEEVCHHIVCSTAGLVLGGCSGLGFGVLGSLKELRHHKEATIIYPIMVEGPSERDPFSFQNPPPQIYEQQCIPKP